jgi:ribosomal protein S18 acetylase RimI-like enzyme
LITLDPIAPSNARIFKAVRLRALQGTPSAFGSTYARESQLSDAEWLRRAARWNGDQAAGFIAMDVDDACGIVCSFLDEEDATRAHLISMWTAPTHRRQGLGARLVNEVIGWARSRGARAMFLRVTSNNDSAMLFYARLGFERTGRTEPYPNDPSLIEYEMSRAITS